MNHLTVTSIDTNVRYRIAGIISTREKDNVPGSRFRCTDQRTLVINALRRCSWHIAVTAVGKHIAYKSRTIEAR